MKIALIGTHGVGKTTLCFDLAARLKRLDRGVHLVTEVARDCPLPINRDTTLDAQTWILHTQCAREIAGEASGDVVVCDRSVLDNYAYLVHALGRRPELDPGSAAGARPTAASSRCRSGRSRASTARGTPTSRSRARSTP